MRKYGTEKAQLYLDANDSALEEYKTLCQTITCDFEEKSSYVYCVTNEKKLEQELISRGATVYLTRENDKDLSTTTVNRKRNDLYNRAKYINNISPDMYISIHLNFKFLPYD